MGSRCLEKCRRRRRKPRGSDIGYPTGDWDSDRQNGPVTASTNDPLTVSVPELDPAALHGSLSTSWGLEGELTAVHGERDRNFRIDAASGRYLLKVHNPADGAEVLDLQYSALRHIRTVAPDFTVSTGFLLAE